MTIRVLGSGQARLGPGQEGRDLARGAAVRGVVQDHGKHPACRIIRPAGMGSPGQRFDHLIDGETREAGDVAEQAPPQVAQEASHAGRIAVIKLLNVGTE